VRKVIKKLSVIVFSVILTFCVACSASVSYTDKYYSVFGDLYMTVSYYDGTDSGIEDLAKQLDNEINPDLSTSYVARFNDMLAGEMEVSKSVYDMVLSSKQIYELSNGAFDITLSELSKIWSVDHNSLEEYYPNSFPALPSYSQVSEINSYMEKIAVRTSEGKYYLSKSVDGAKIDLGGIAKGYLSDLVFAKLKSNGARSAVIDVSGNLCLLGKKLDEKGNKSDWKIGVNNCFDDGGLYLCGAYFSGDCSVITSGTYERYYEKDGIKVNHIINPNTKMPVGIKFENSAYSNSTDHVVSVTVIGGSGAVCDAVATAVCVLGIRDGIELVEKLNLSALIVTADKKYSTVGSIRLMDGRYYLDNLEEIK
jgi:thiamine biosynthesis lipoprotein